MVKNTIAFWAKSLARMLRPNDPLPDSKLFSSGHVPYALTVALVKEWEHYQRTVGIYSPELLGTIYNEATVDQNATGSFYTPADIAKQLLSKLTAINSDSTCCDPACGGGALLLAAIRKFELKPENIFGFDIDEMAVEITRFAIWLETGYWSINNIIKKNMIIDNQLNYRFDLVVANPPWVAYSGRHGKPLDNATKEFLRINNPAFADYLTLHGAFVYICSVILKENGYLAMLLPSSVSDGIRMKPTRDAHDATCEVVDLFSLQTNTKYFKSTIGLISRKSSGVSNWSRIKWTEEEKIFMEKMNKYPKFPLGTFKTNGYQSRKGDIWSTNQLPGMLPIHVGADVSENGLNPVMYWYDPKTLRNRMHSADEYAKVNVFLRQTAVHPRACKGDGVPYRNSIFGAYTPQGWTDDQFVNYLNSEGIRRYFRLSCVKLGIPQLYVWALEMLPMVPTTLDVG